MQATQARWSSMLYLYTSCLYILLWGITVSAADDASRGTMGNPHRLGNTYHRRDAPLPAATTAQSELLSRKLQLDEDKYQPGKGDVACTDIEDLWEQHLEDNEDTPRLPPCRNTTTDGEVITITPPGFGGFIPILGDGSNIAGDNDGENVANAGSAGPSTRPPTPSPTAEPTMDARNNTVVVSVLAALRPGRANFRLPISRATTIVLDVTLDEYNFFLSPPRRLQRLGQFQQEQPPQQDRGGKYDMFYQSTNVVQIREFTDRWWWRYDFEYECFWRKTGLAVLNQTLLGEHSVVFTDGLQKAIDSGEFLRGIHGDARDSILELTVLEESAPPMPTDQAGIFEGDEDPTFPNPLDPQGWDYRRWLGLGLFCGTFVMTLLLTQVASYRKRRRMAKEAWGNLGTESGVDELLKTGWNIKGSQMEIYDKTKVGYRDDDSVLMGGFEQKHKVIGAEITVSQQSTTTPPSTRTPDTGSGRP